MDNFEEARVATENMFEVPVEETPAEATEQPAEAPIEETPNVTEEATKVAEEATKIAEEQNAELSRLMSENEELKAKSEQLQKTISEMSTAREEEIVEEAMSIPEIDFNELAFADAETQAKAREEYANAMAKFVRKGIMDEMSPYIEQAKEGQREKEKREAISVLSQIPELTGIDTMLPQLESIISRNKWLQSEDMPIDEKLINAYAIAKGVNAINTPVEEKKELTPEELMELYDKNPTFQELVEKKRIESVKNSQQVPPFSASSGAVNVALNIKEKPKSWDDASERTRQMFSKK
jgi:hypothetical protein